MITKVKRHCTITIRDFSELGINSNPYLREAAKPAVTKPCVYCAKQLTGKNTKYCGDLCKFRFLSLKNNKPKPRSKAQDLRILRASRKKTDVRYN